MNKVILIVGIVIALAGAAFAFLPHEAHNAVFGAVTGHVVEESRSSHDNGNHGFHQTLGLSIALLGAATALAGWKIF
jgi:hypothetical protein